MDSEAQRIRELVIEAGALVDWVGGGRGDLEVVGAALLYLHDELGDLAAHTTDGDARAAACGMVTVIEETLARKAGSGTAAA